MAHLLINSGCQDKFGIDIGCGTGNPYIFSLVSKQVVCVDVSLTAVEKLMESYNVICLVADGKKLPFENNYFDFVVMSGVVHHIIGQKGEITQLFDEIFRVLKNDGKVFFMEPNILYPPSILMYIPNRILQLIKPGIRGRVSYERPILFYEVKNKLEKSGFKKICFYPVSFTNPYMPYFIIKIFLKYESKMKIIKWLRYFVSWFIVSACK